MSIVTNTISNKHTFTIEEATVLETFERMLQETHNIMAIPSSPKPKAKTHIGYHHVWKHWRMGCPGEVLRTESLSLPKMPQERESNSLQLNRSQSATQKVTSVGACLGDGQRRRVTPANGCCRRPAHIANTTFSTKTQAIDCNHKWQYNIPILTGASLVSSASTAFRSSLLLICYSFSWLVILLCYAASVAVVAIEASVAHL